ncbi:hypothetical protein ACSTLH_00070, partial [Vibrio parahaemolyticus]
GSQARTVQAGSLRDQLAALGSFIDALADQLAAAGDGKGATIVGSDAIAGNPYAVAAGTVRAQLSAILGNVNAHAASGDHDNRYLRVSLT